MAFLPRHGKKHTIRPTDIPVRANIYALKQLGVKRILAPSTVGSLREEYHPGDIVFTDQFIDRTTRREQSFYTVAEGKVCHITVAEPMCPELHKTVIQIAKDLKIKMHETGTYVCIEGPRFSTKAEIQHVPHVGSRHRRHDTCARMRSGTGSRNMLHIHLHRNRLRRLERPPSLRGRHRKNHERQHRKRKTHNRRNRQKTANRARLQLQKRSTRSIRINTLIRRKKAMNKTDKNTRFKIKNPQNPRVQRRRLLGHSPNSKRQNLL